MNPKCFNPFGKTNVLKHHGLSEIIQFYSNQVKHVSNEFRKILLEKKKMEIFICHWKTLKWLIKYYSKGGFSNPEIYISFRNSEITNKEGVYQHSWGRCDQ